MTNTETAGAGTPSDRPMQHDEALRRAGMVAIRIGREGDIQAAETVRAQIFRIQALEADNETLRTGYAAARLEIESLRARSAEPVGARTHKDYAIEHAEYMAKDAEHQPPGNHGEKPLPLFARDIAADFGATPVQVCLALVELGFGHLSVNIAITPEIAEKLREYFAHAAQQAPAQAAPAAVALPSDSAIPGRLGYSTLMRLADENGLGPNNVSGKLQARIELYGRAVERAAIRAQQQISSTPTTQPAPQQEAQEPVAWYVTGCGRLLDEYDAEAEARRIGGTAKAMPLYTVPQPSPASQGDALDAVETKRYADGTTATGIGPLPKHSPSVQHALRVLIDVESMLGGANGPTIQIRAVLESLAAQEGKSHG